MKRIISRCQRMNCNARVGKTLARLQRNYPWTCMRAAVIEYVKSCLMCNKRKAVGGSKAPLNPWPLVEGVWEGIALDIVGPVQESAKEYRLHADSDALSRYPTDAPQELDEKLQCMLAALSVDLESKTALQCAQKIDWKLAFAELEKGKPYPQYRLRDGNAKVMEDGLLLRLFFPQSFREEVMHACHHDITAGRKRLTRTLLKIQARYYWPGMAEDIRDFLRKCHECQSCKPVYHRPAGFMEIQRSERHFERLVMDILGPFPLSKGGNTNIVVAIAYVMKWVETKALSRVGATEVAHFLVKCVLLCHGASRQLTIDQGRCFMAEVTQKVLQAIETNHTPTTAYRPQANGLVERLSHILADMLSMYVSADHRNWDKSLPLVTFAYNTSRQESTERFTLYLVYGREAILSVDGALNSDPNLVPPMTKTLLSGPWKGYNELATRCRGSASLCTKGKRFGTTKGAKVGKSENLLHRWFGLYAVVTTPRNYELRRGLSPKSEIVHVERIKPFVDCVSSRPPAPVPMTTGGQPEESSGDHSPQAHADNQEQEPPPEAKMTIPRPAVPLVEEEIGGPRLIGELDLMSAKEVVAYQGVIFKSEGEVAFSDSEWLVATYLTFNHLKTTMKTLREWLEVKVDTMANRYDGPRDKFKLTLQKHLKGRALIELGKLRRYNQRFSDLKAAVNLQSARRKRGLIDGGGKVLNWLFGVSKQEDLEHVHGRLDKLSTETTSIEHALEVHASLINERLWETKALADAVGELQTAFAQVERETWKLDQKIEGVAREMEIHWIAITKVEDALRQLESALAWLDKALNYFLVGIATMSMGRLSVTLFPPLQVQAVLKEIKAVLPPSWSLSPYIQNGDIWKVYTEAKVVVATVSDYLRIFIHLPVFEFPFRFTLYEVISLPNPISNFTLGAQFEPLPPFLAVASDSQAFVELTVSDSSRFVASCTSICPISRAVNRNYPEPSCAIALFLNDELENLIQLLPEPAEEETPSSLEKKGVTANKPLLLHRAKFQGRISPMGEHLRVIEEEEKARVTMEVNGTVKLRYLYELVIAIVGLLLGFAASLVFSWHRYHLSFVSVTQRLVELEGRLVVPEADVGGGQCSCVRVSSFPLLVLSFECCALCSCPCGLKYKISSYSRIARYNILVISDYANRFVFTVPMRNQTAQTIAKVLVNKIFTKYESPEVVVTDQGTNFLSSLIQEV
ncbi:Uncharacterized protein APZ42_034225 [Daphnia magna]|uniref:RNA-directed DNA polymerase n=1 Tax=Daphnia magna TaxID=35525 RepID=A0A164KBD5_9CRUS|nr:Uncharacterized protein APZ42_034225 [Daphnia magna]